MTETISGPGRRAFLGGAAGAVAAATVLSNLGETAAEAVTAPRRRGRLDDIEHVVILMQENRSFDHYYGSMRGVRGFGDKTALRLPSGRDVFHQPDAKRPDGGFLLPFHVDTTKVDGQDLSDLDHSWEGTHAAWNAGHEDAWVGVKGELTMSYFTRNDIPFHRALASAFTVCDNYFCSVAGPTTPNRLYLWSGMIDPNGTAGGPAYFNPADYKPVYDWTTYPERLQAAGISWQVYANDEVGDGDDGYLGDYGDNPLWLFQAYHDALASADPKVRQLAERASLRDEWKPDSGLGKNIDHVLAQFIADCKTGSLPSVSWVVAPYAYSEHPQARPVDGAAYTAGVLNALWDNPELWSKTAVFIDFDENDGFFDHVVPPTAPAGTPDEYILGLPIGLGPRVPMTVISPWSRGGFVNSQVFDHTSVIRFLEAWTGVREENISAWRRKICGDLTSAFDFGQHSTSIPTLPDTTALRRQADATQTKLPPPEPPAVGRQIGGVQERGTAPARPLPYQPMANVLSGPSEISLALSNSGSAALQLSVYAYHLSTVPPARYDLDAGGSVHAQVPTVLGGYDVAVHGPNGFLRTAQGNLHTAGVQATLELSHGRLGLLLRNDGQDRVRLRVGGHEDVSLSAGQQRRLEVRTDCGWYDVTITVPGQSEFGRRFAGHLEDGKPSRTG